MKWIFDQTVRRAFEDTQAVFSHGSEMPLPALFFARMADLARSNSFLWVEAGLQTQERYSRVFGVGEGLSRSVLLGAVATDIFVGYTTLRERARWWPGLVRKKDWELQHQRGANRILDTAASLGGALIKACQFASTRPDLLPANYIRTLSQLQDRIPPHDWPTMEAAITRELKRPSKEVFAEIDPVPVAAASIAQVHRARLLDGRKVAIKIQYPEIGNIVATDLALMERVFKTIASFSPAIQLQPILDYLKGTLPMELDFKREAKAMTDLRFVLEHRSDVVIPKVITELNTSRMIVMEFVLGVFGFGCTALVQANISPTEVARLLNDLYAEQMQRLGILHADPHPGNILVQPGPRLVLLDHGITVSLSPSLVKALVKMVQTLETGNFDELRDVLVEAGLKLDKNVDADILLQLVGMLFSGEEAENAFEAGARLSKSVGSIPFDLLMVGRALGLLNGITQQLDPEIDVLEIISAYAKTDERQAEVS